MCAEVPKSMETAVDANQYFAALTNMRSVGVMGDERTYDYAVALRAVNTVDFMTAGSARYPVRGAADSNEQDYQ